MTDNTNQKCEIQTGGRGTLISLCNLIVETFVNSRKTSASSNGKSFKYQKFTSSGFKDRKMSIQFLCPDKVLYGIIYLTSGN